MSPAAWLAVGAVRTYQWTLRPILGGQCRFYPSCSDYAAEALRTHGAIRGAGLAGWRILRCNPWCQGGCDEVPDNMPWKRRQASPSAGLFTGLLPPDSGSVPAAATPTTAATDQ